MAEGIRGAGVSPAILPPCRHTPKPPARRRRCQSCELC